MMIKVLCVVVVLVTSAICVPVDNPLRKMTPRITGTGYSEIKDLPYQAQLIRDDSILLCGAAIINKQWLLSASHCFVDGFNSVTVLTGSTYRLKGKKSFIEKVYQHPNFNHTLLDNDICLIKLKEPLQLNANQNTIPVSYSELRPGLVIQISGYGRESDDSLHSPVIKAAHVPVVNKKVCIKRYSTVNDILTDSMFCAGDGLHDACLGDSGGPAVYNGHLVGIISAGRFCGSLEFPGVYTKLSIYQDWIESTLRSAGAIIKKKFLSKAKAIHFNSKSHTLIQIEVEPNREPNSTPEMIGLQYPLQYQPDPRYNFKPYVSSNVPTFYNQNPVPTFMNYVQSPNVGKYEWNIRDNPTGYLQERYAA